jgi:hypothetical protein
MQNIASGLRRIVLSGLHGEGADVVFRGGIEASGEIEVEVPSQPTTGPVEARDLRCDRPPARERRA